AAPQAVAETTSLGRSGSPAASHQMTAASGTTKQARRKAGSDQPRYIDLQGKSQYRLVRQEPYAKLTSRLSMIETNNIEEMPPRGTMIKDMATKKAPSVASPRCC